MAGKRKTRVNADGTEYGARPRPPQKAAESQRGGYSGVDSDEPVNVMHRAWDDLKKDYGLTKKK